ncbi:MAG TPA: lysylphosphatidylglycerol synthase domain-containing protein [Actinomycetales bacterium]|nr:lysylphosphatidylglycerol synthase domain-containing protein [Actinomycetales bacterium]
MSDAGRRRRLLGAARLLLAAGVVVAVVWALAGQWDDVRADLARVSIGALLLAFALALLSLVFTLLGWRALLADLGSPLHVAPASGVLFVGQLGKYVPGSIWTVVAQAEVAARLGVPRRRSAVAGLLSVLLSALAGLGIGVVALPGLLDAGGSRWYLLLLLLLPLGAVALHPRVLGPLVRLAFRLVRRDPPEKDLSGRAIAVTAVSFVVAWLCLGLQVWVLVVDLGGDAADAVVPAVFGYALAASVGMLAVFLPAGVVLREVVLVLLLEGTMGRTAATAVVILSRFVVTVSDVVAAGAGWAYARSHRLLARDGAGRTGAG